ncbi:MAG: RNA polymerase sigma factor [Solirubrobacteraceae bacterium]
MAPLESLPPDQRAVLQLVLQRGRTYDEIAAMLSIDRAAVRDRALQAFDAIGPPNRLTAERRALITDYLMGQLPPRVAEQIHERLASSPPERAWARALASDLSTLAKSPLPEIPSSLEAAGQAAPPAAAAAPPTEPPADVPAAAEPPAGAGRPRRRPPAERQPAATGAQPTSAGPAGPSDSGDAGYGRRDSAGDAGGPPTSRRGGAIMLVAGMLVVIVIIVVAIILSNNSGSSHSGSVAQTPASTGQATGTGSASTPATGATSSTGTGTGSATTPTGTTGATGVQVLGQMRLKSPTGTTSPTGAAEIVKQNGKEGIVLLAQGVAPNTKHNAYAVWLYNGPGKAYRLGFVNPAVGASGKISTATPLPPNVTSYKYVLVTLETTPNSKVPGHIVLQGPLVLG